MKELSCMFSESNDCLASPGKMRALLDKRSLTTSADLSSEDLSLAWLPTTMMKISVQKPKEYQISVQERHSRRLTQSQSGYSDPFRATAKEFNSFFYLIILTSYYFYIIMPSLLITTLILTDINFKFTQFQILNG